MMSTQKRFISDKEALAILNAGSYGVLSTASRDGQPYGVAVNYYFSGDENCIFFHCAVSGRKIDNILENNKVSFIVTGPNEVIPEKLTTYYESVIVQGRAAIVSDEEEKKEKLLSICRKFAPHKKGLDEVIKQSSHATAVVKINIESISGKRNRG
jgi:nitroimidazol reductase NimA-like FMN-containing flavoprotein (pyridoxamine 5'-phosphate oxidase superfamily)